MPGGRRPSQMVRTSATAAATPSPAAASSVSAVASSVRSWAVSTWSRRPARVAPRPSCSSRRSRRRSVSRAATMDSRLRCNARWRWSAAIAGAAWSATPCRTMTSRSCSCCSPVARAHLEVADGLAPVPQREPSTLRLVDVAGPRGLRARFPGLHPHARTAQAQVFDDGRAHDSRDQGNVGAGRGQPGGEVGGDHVGIGAMPEVETVHTCGELATERLDDRSGDAGGQRRAQHRGLLADGLDDSIDDGEDAQVRPDQADRQTGGDQRPAHGEVEVVEPVPGHRDTDGQRHQSDRRRLHQHVGGRRQQSLGGSDREEHGGGDEQYDDLTPRQPTCGPVANHERGQCHHHARHEQYGGQDAQRLRSRRGGHQLGNLDPAHQRLVIQRDAQGEQHDAGHRRAGGPPPDAPGKQPVGVEQRDQGEQRQKARHPQEALEL